VISPLPLIRRINQMARSTRVEFEYSAQRTIEKFDKRGANFWTVQESVASRARGHADELPKAIGLESVSRSGPADRFLAVQKFAPRLSNFSIVRCAEIVRTPHEWNEPFWLIRLYQWKRVKSQTGNVKSVCHIENRAAVVKRLYQEPSRGRRSFVNVLVRRQRRYGAVSQNAIPSSGRIE